MRYGSLLLLTAVLGCAMPPAAEHPTPHGEGMIMATVDSFTVMAMAQAFPTYTTSYPRTAGTSLEPAEAYVTQPAIMANLSSPRHAVVLRTTINFEGITQPDGELSFGAWGEGFIDKRHPHTLLHEMMLSVNGWRGTNGYSISAGRGFAAYGTDDPMSRPVLKYPTNHHLSQVLERWTVTGMASLSGWSLEASVFGGIEPTGPYDLDNFEGFGKSWSARLTRRFGTGAMGTWPWELSFSHAFVQEHDQSSTLNNVAFRHEHDHGAMKMYYLVEASRSDPEFDDAYFSILGEGSLAFGRHKPYGRIEYASRPEYAREGVPPSDDAFRYDHDARPLGTSRWLIVTGGYGFTLRQARLSPRPYVEAQFNKVRPGRNQIDVASVFGRSSFWSISAGMRIFLGGDPMRMGVYGVVDPMTAMHHAEHMQETTTPHHH